MDKNDNKVTKRKGVFKGKTKVICFLFNPLIIIHNACQQKYKKKIKKNYCLSIKVFFLKHRI